MIQFNLLPDSKLESVRARQAERTIMVFSIAASAVSVGILVLSFLAVGVQKAAMSSADKSIQTYEAQVKAIPNVNNYLTIQNQLKTLVSLHSQEPAVSRLFSYLPQITPTQASIGQLTVNFDTQSMQISGTASSLAAVNKFADVLKFTTYKVDSQSSGKTAFTSVILSSFGRDTSGASYNFDLTYDPALFDASQNVSLTVPQNYISTRSFIELPNSALFSGTSGSAASSNTGGTPQ